jgi:UDP-N-acetylmuramate dehydrogenase
LDRYLENENVSYKKDFSLSELSFLKVGGTCKYLVLPDTEHKLRRILEYLSSASIPFLVIGKLSNTIVRDGIIETVIISTAQLKNHVFTDKGEYRAEAGASLPEMARHLSDAGYVGFSGLVGVPASIGGAIYMNAGCFGNQISDYLIRVRCIDGSGKIVELQKDELEFSWRHSAFHQRLKGYVILEAFFAPEHGCISQIQSHMEECRTSRNSFQEKTYPNLGSIFATRDIYAVLAQRFWRYRFGCLLIRLWVRLHPKDRLKLALKLFNGYTQQYFGISSNERVGFSECTFNCIVNKGGANASEIIAFIREVEKRLRHCLPLEIEIYETIP